jgi:uncharacterized membrane protein YfcA
LLSGALIGFSGGMLGIGGGLLAIPLLGLVLGMDQQLAQGTALIMVLPAVLLTVRKYHQRAKIDLRAAAAGAVSSIVFTWVGAQIALGLDSLLLRRVYAVFILGIAIFYFYQGLRRRDPGKPAVPRRDASEFHKGWFVLMGVMAGTAGGIFGVGGAVLAVPFMTTFLRLSQIGAQGLGLMMVIPGTFVGLMTYASHGQVDWLVGVPLALGSIVFVPYGVKFAYGLPEPRLKTFFACMLLVIICLLLIKA